MDKVPVPKEPEPDVEQVDGFGDDYNEDEEDEDAPVVDVQLPVSVTLDRSGGKTLGLAIFSAESFDVGLEVIKVVSGEQADTAGVRVHDRVVSINGVKTLGMTDQDAGALIVKDTTLVLHILQADDDVRDPNAQVGDDEVQLRLLREAERLREQAEARTAMALAKRQREQDRLERERQELLLREKAVFEAGEQEEKRRRAAEQQRLRQSHVETKAVVAADGSSNSFWKTQRTTAQISAPLLEPSDVNHRTSMQGQLSSRIAESRLNEESMKASRKHLEEEAVRRVEQQRMMVEQRQNAVRLQQAIETQRRVNEQQDADARRRAMEKARAEQHRVHNTQIADVMTERLHDNAAQTRAQQLAKHKEAAARRQQLEEEVVAAKQVQVQHEREIFLAAEAAEKVRREKLEAENKARISARLQFERTQTQNNQWKNKAHGSGVTKVSGGVAESIAAVRVQANRRGEEQRAEEAAERQRKHQAAMARKQQLGAEKEEKAVAFRARKDKERAEAQQRREAEAKRLAEMKARQAREFDPAVQIRLEKEALVLRQKAEEQNRLAEVKSRALVDARRRDQQAQLDREQILFEKAEEEEERRLIEEKEKADRERERAKGIKKGTAGVSQFWKQINGDAGKGDGDKGGDGVGTAAGGGGMIF